MYENKKITKIVDETSTYLLNKKAHKLEVQIIKKVEYSIILITGQGADVSEEELKRLQKSINQRHRESEMEEYYWTLAGDGEESAELGLVAVMVDEAVIEKEGDVVTVKLKRLNHVI